MNNHKYVLYIDEIEPAYRSFKGFMPNGDGLLRNSLSRNHFTSSLSGRLFGESKYRDQLFSDFTNLKLKFISHLKDTCIDSEYAKHVVNNISSFDPEHDEIKGSDLMYSSINLKHNVLDHRSSDTYYMKYGITDMRSDVMDFYVELLNILNKYDYKFDFDSIDTYSVLFFLRFPPCPFINKFFKMSIDKLNCLYSKFQMCFLNWVLTTMPTDLRNKFLDVNNFSHIQFVNDLFLFFKNTSSKDNSKDLDYIMSVVTVIKDCLDDKRLSMIINTCVDDFAKPVLKNPQSFFVLQSFDILRKFYHATIFDCDIICDTGYYSNTKFDVNTDIGKFFYNKVFSDLNICTHDSKVDCGIQIVDLLLHVPSKLIQYLNDMHNCKIDVGLFIGIKQSFDDRRYVFDNDFISVEKEILFFKTVLMPSDGDLMVSHVGSRDIFLYRAYLCSQLSMLRDSCYNCSLYMRRLSCINSKHKHISYKKLRSIIHTGFSENYRDLYSDFFKII